MKLLHRLVKRREQIYKPVANMPDSKAFENYADFITNGLRNTLCTEALQMRDIQAATHYVGETIPTRCKKEKVGNAEAETQVWVACLRSYTAKH